MFPNSSASEPPTQELKNSGLKQVLETEVISACEVDLNRFVLKWKPQPKLKIFQVDVLDVSAQDVAMEQERNDSLRNCFKDVDIEIKNRDEEQATVSISRRACSSAGGP